MPRVAARWPAESGQCGWRIDVYKNVAVEGTEVVMWEQKPGQLNQKWNQIQASRAFPNNNYPTAHLKYNHDISYTPTTVRGRCIRALTETINIKSNKELAKETSIAVV